MKSVRAQMGFTLVEIAIVLVIIGLLLGGVLKGQEMITSAKIKNVINDLNGVTTAFASYQDRYKAIPGDDLNAVGRWGAVTINGNGNGQIAGNYNNAITVAPVAGQESNLFWQHLRLAGFVPGPTQGPGSGGQPQNAAGGMIGVETGNPGTSGLGFASLIICAANLPDKIAIAVDTQLDDQNAITGQIRGQKQSGPNPATVKEGEVGVSDANYVDNGTNQYLICKAI